MLAIAAAGCTSPSVTVSPVPIPVSLRGGALTASASIDGVADPLPLLIDTGTPFTAYDDGMLAVRGRIGVFTLFSSGPDPVARLQIRNTQLFQTPLGAVGVGPAPFDVSAVLGGDNLARITMMVDYRGTPQVRFQPQVTTCSCELADACEAVFPFTLYGGTQAIAIGENVYPYPPTRVLIDVCLEPLSDPVSEVEPLAANPKWRPKTPCAAGGEIAAPYRATGVDVRLIVATGFPGFAVGAKAYDRLRGPGAARAAIEAPDAALVALPDPRTTAMPIRAGRATLGGGQVSALALVSREVYLGPCGELARSRRQRVTPSPRVAVRPGQPTDAERACQISRDSPKGDPAAMNCTADPPEACDDLNDRAPTAAVIELTAPVPTFVIDDTTALLQSINADVRPIQPDRPSSPSVEGVIGTEVLRRLVSTIDYPNARLIARCAEDVGCLTYPRFTIGNECGRNCTAQSCLVPTAPLLDPPVRGDPLLPGDRLSPDPRCPAIDALANRGGRCPAAPGR